MVQVKSEQIIQRLAVVFIILVNGLFCLKYSYRATYWYLPLTVGYMAFVGLSCTYGMRILQRLPTTITFWGGMVGFLLVSVVLMVVVDKDSLHVDRWLMIATFWDNIRDGVYPYVPRYGPNIPSQLPVYHILAYPFYTAGEVGFYSVAVLVTWVFLLREKYKTQTWFVLLMICVSAGVWWEIVSRSTIIMNMVLVIVMMMYIDTAKPKTVWHHVILGVLSGFLLATRVTVVFPLIVMFSAYYLRQRAVQHVIAMAVAALFTIGLVLLPLYIMDNKYFWQYNPLLVQSYFTNSYITAILLVLSFIGGYLGKSPVLRYGICGILMVLTTMWASQIHYRYFGPWAMIFDSKFDISYYLQAFPYFVMALLPNLRGTDTVTNG